MSLLQTSDKNIRLKIKYYKLIVTFLQSLEYESHYVATRRKKKDVT